MHRHLRITLAIVMLCTAMLAGPAAAEEATPDYPAQIAKLEAKLAAEKARSTRLRRGLTNTKKALRREKAAHRAHHAARWRSAKVSVYGGPYEVQGVAGPYPSTATLEKRGTLYFAHKTMRFGTKVRFRYRGREATAICVDRGPYCGGRVFDLGANTAKELNFSGVDTVKWRVVKR